MEIDIYLLKRCVHSLIVWDSNALFVGTSRETRSRNRNIVGVVHN